MKTLLGLPVACLGASVHEALRSPAGLSYLSTTLKYADAAMLWPENYILQQLQVHLWQYWGHHYCATREPDAESTLRSTFVTHILHLLPRLIRCASARLR